MEKQHTINGYDLLKTFAVVIMIADHIGYYFYPDDLWWRAVGRIGFPIWFFLVGHARGRDISGKLLGGAVVLVAANIVTGMSVLPLNALFTIIFLRLMIDTIAEPLKERPKAVWPLLGILAVLILPTDIVTEYGTLALMFALFGYLVRHREDMPYTGGQMQAFIVSVTILFLLYQWANFGFSPLQLVVMAIGTTIVCAVLSAFNGRDYPFADRAVPNLIKPVFTFCGRRTLEIYVAHLLLFKFMALAMGMAGYQLFKPSLM